MLKILNDFNKFFQGETPLLHKFKPETKSLEKHKALLKILTQKMCSDLTRAILQIFCPWRRFMWSFLPPITYLKLNIVKSLN